jgi:hypothetical protein
VSVRSFRVDLAAAEAARADAEPLAALPAASTTPWAGDVEPVSFPFRPGLTAEATAFGFDADGEWLVVVGRDGILHGLAFDGSPPEVLPRAFRDGVVLKEVDAVLGVSGGVVVCGRFERAAPPDNPGEEWLVAAHYDRATRRVTLHDMRQDVAGRKWSAFPDLHCITVIKTLVGAAGNTGVALDLATLGRCPTDHDETLVSRAMVAWQRAWKDGAPPYSLPVMTQSPASGSLPGGGAYLMLSGNSILLRQTPQTWAPFEPQRDGKPLLGGTSITHAQLAGDVLALSLSRPGERQIVLFRGPDGRVLGETSHYPAAAAFALSADGRFIACRRPRRVVVSETATFATTVAEAPHAGLHNWLYVRLDAYQFRLELRIGVFEHTFSLNADAKLVHALARRNEVMPKPGTKPGYVLSAAYDPTRFPPTCIATSGRWSAVLDRLGQVVLFHGSHLVASFLIRRERAAAWEPGRAFWGDAALIGGAPTPDADLRIGRAILAAGGEP